MKPILALLLFASAAFGQAAHSNLLTITLTLAPNSDPIQGTYIQRAPPCSPTPCIGAGTFTTLATLAPLVFSYTDSTVLAGQTWWYQAVSFNSGGTLTSNQISLVTPFLQPSGTVTLSGTSK